MSRQVFCRECPWSADLDDAFPNGQAKCPNCGGQRLDSGPRTAAPAAFQAITPEHVETLVTGMYAQLEGVPESTERADYAVDWLADLGLAEPAIAALTSAVVAQMIAYERAHTAELYELVDTRADELAEERGRDPLFATATQSDYRRWAAEGA